MGASEPCEMMFQSTLPHGERQILQSACSREFRFNPRSHMGSDLKTGCLSSLQREFQSTLPHGERHLFTVFKIIELCFNPRSHMGSDELLTERGMTQNVSIHAPTWGATKARLNKWQISSSFNPRSHMGSD